MPDISKCTNKNCPLSKKCHRYTVEPSEHRQSYSSFTYYVDDNEEIICDHFISNIKHENTGS
jgi:hypothetical protein